MKKLPIGKSKRGAVLIYPSPKRAAGHRRAKGPRGTKVPVPTHLPVKEQREENVPEAMSQKVNDDIEIDGHNLLSSVDDTERPTAGSNEHLKKDNAHNSYVEVVNAADAADLTLTKSWIDDSLSDQCPGIVLTHDDVKVFEVNTSMLKQPPGPDLKPKKSSMRDGSRSTSSRSDHVSFKESVDVLPISPTSGKMTHASAGHTEE